MSNLTLRKKRKDRPTISGPQPSLPNNPRPAAPQQQKSGSSSLAPPRERNAPTETSDLVKRRYSTRYNQLPDFSNLDAPAVPSLPGALKRASRGGSPKRPSRQSGGPIVQVDQSTLDDPNLQHERYVTDLLSNASEQEIQDYQNSIRRIKNRTSTNLKQSVYQNRTQFIKISKEAEKLKSEMQTLRGLMADLTTALAQTNTSASSSNGTLSPSPSTRRNAHRTSIANLESMWNVQLQQLWRQVEKSQKFLPAIPGRHIITENGSWVELDAATWKPKRPVHLFLLNDHLLIASKKRKRMDPNNPSAGPAPTKLVAEECFPLQDIDLVDMSTAISTTTPAEERAIATAITLRAGGRALTYRSEKRDPKVKIELMQTFRKAVEDLRKQSLASPDPSALKASAQQDSLNYFASRDPNATNNGTLLDTLATTHSPNSKPDIMIEVDGKTHNFRWLEAQIDDLDIDIALHVFPTAVSKLESLRRIASSSSLKSNTIARDLITSQLDERAAKLAITLIREMIETPSHLEATKTKVAFLTRLGFEDRAREAYLTARSKALSERARQCVFEGDLHRFVFSLSYVYFTMIKNTILIFQASFGNAGTAGQSGGNSMSAVITWANTHLESFNGVLQRQMAAVEKGGKVWRDCMDLVWEGEKGLREGEGLDFRSVVGRGLEDGPVARARQRSVSQGGSREQSRSKSRVRTPVNGVGAPGAR